MGEKRKPVVGNSARKKKKKDGLVMSPKQIRARAKRAGGLDTLTSLEKEGLFKKPMEEWDFEELARGRPKAKDGRFHGPTPHWVTREMHEKAMELFKKAVRADMQATTVRGLSVLQEILDNNEVDDRGKPMVAAGVKVDVAKFLIEHLIGKPTQPVQTDINITLQRVLGDSLVMPDEIAGYIPSSSHREIQDAEVIEDGPE
jgi:hypothetical protein